MEEHIHPRQVVGRVVDLLPKEPLFYRILFQLLSHLQEERPRARCWVIDLVNLGLLVKCETRKELRNVLRRKELAPRLTCIRRIVGNKKLVCIAKEVDMVFLKLAKV